MSQLPREGNNIANDVLFVESTFSINPKSFFSIAVQSDPDKPPITPLGFLGTFTGDGGESDCETAARPRLSRDRMDRRVVFK